MRIVNKSKMNLNKNALDREILKKMRSDLLNAWDTLAGNASFGTVAVSDERKNELLQWHQNVLDLDEYAIRHVPEEVLYYLNKEET